MQGIDFLHTVRYAVIEAVYSNAGSERIVVQYTTYEALNELIADSRIVGSGFSSRFHAYELARTSERQETADRWNSKIHGRKDK